MNNNIDWIIHLVANGACDECGKTSYKKSRGKSEKSKRNGVE